MGREIKKTYAKVMVDNTTGEVIKEEYVYKQRAEPHYIKLYIDCLCDFKGISKSLNPILLGFVKRMSYAASDKDYGGQILYLNAAFKKAVAAECGVSLKRVDQAITHFVKSGIFARVATATYQVNPEMFGRGQWKDIKNIRATFDFGAGTVETEILRGDDSEAV